MSKRHDIDFHKIFEPYIHYGVPLTVSRIKSSNDRIIASDVHTGNLLKESLNHDLIYSLDKLPN